MAMTGPGQFFVLLCPQSLNPTISYLSVSQLSMVKDALQVSCQCVEIQQDLEPNIGINLIILIVHSTLQDPWHSA